MSTEPRVELAPSAWVIDPDRVFAHVGHDVEIATYADQNLAIECVDCGEVIADIDYSTF